MRIPFRPRTGRAEGNARARLYRANVDGRGGRGAAAGTARWRRLGLLLLTGLLLAGLAGATWWWLQRGAERAALQRVVLLLPDDPALDPVAVQAWRDAADELGFPLETVTDAQLLGSDPLLQGAALIVPDTIHRRMSDAAIDALQRRVADGARLMLVHDAGLANSDGQYAAQRSRLSALVGVDYAVYAELRTGMLREAPVTVRPEQVQALQIPPGKLVRGPRQQLPHSSGQPPLAVGEALTLASYVYGPLKYMTFVTRGAYGGTTLMSAPDGSLIAGLRRVGGGQVLFVNLPLTMLTLRTDAMPMHAMLRYFAQQVAGLPQLSPLPQGRGAVVMNWHIDDRKALPALARAAELGAFEQGPYSLHFTVGPDVNEPGDGKGMDLANNPEAQAWVQRLAAAGHEVGSHGGWIHNWFGDQVGKIDPAEAAALIERNAALIGQVSGRPVREYSAPVGNHPSWVTGWLHERGIRSYYFTGNSGAAPTRSYQDGRAPLSDSWSFPVLSFGVFASFEEAKANATPEAEVAAWLRDVNHFCADHHTSRLVYFHPFGIVMYPNAFRQWLEDAKALVARDRLRWITMAQYTDFANTRLRARWSIGPALAGDATGAASAVRPRVQLLRAEHPESLAGLAWLLPEDRYHRPEVAEGQARVERVDGQWRVVVTAGQRLVLRLTPQPRLYPFSPTS